MRTAALHNLGCKVNAYETEAMRQSLEEHGYKIVQFNEKADIYIINTCTVTNMADRKSRQMLHRAKKLNPDAVVVAVGCYVQAAGETIRDDEAIDIIIGNNHKADLVHILEAYFESGESNVFLEDFNSRILASESYNKHAACIRVVYDIGKNFSCVFLVLTQL